MKYGFLCKSNKNEWLHQKMFSNQYIFVTQKATGTYLYILSITHSKRSLHFHSNFKKYIIIVSSRRHFLISKKINSVFLYNKQTPYIHESIKTNVTFLWISVFATMWVIFPITSTQQPGRLWSGLTTTTIVTMLLLSNTFLFALHKTYSIFHFKIHLLLWVLCTKSICTSTSNGIIVISYSSSSFVCGKDTQQVNFFSREYT